MGKVQLKRSLQVDYLDELNKTFDLFGRLEKPGGASTVAAMVDVAVVVKISGE